MGYEGFSGNESILYHLGSPCRIADVGPLRRLERSEWVPDAHVHRLADFRGLEAGGDPVNGRRLMMFNGDLEVYVAKPTEGFDGFYRNGEGDEVIYVHRGGGVLQTVFGQVAFRQKDYLLIPRGTTVAFSLPEDEEQFWLVFHTPGEIETPQRYRNRYGQLLEHAPYSQRDFRGPTELETFDSEGSFRLLVRVRGSLQEYELDRHPFDVVGWDGYVWPYAFNADDFEPRVGRFHLPPPTHQTFQGPGFVICTFAPRLLDWDPEAVPLPYHHSNIQSEEVMFYAEGDYAARKAVDIGCVTLHPSGLPHGPQPGTVEKALGATRTNELAVMWDTFRPLSLTTLWQQHDKPEYAYSWNPDRSGGEDAGAAAGADAGDGAATVTGPSA
jgi:homogentisate 1,2-dioxygenase